jgi:hypothetical protein
MVTHHIHAERFIGHGLSVRRHIPIDVYAHLKFTPSVSKYKML